MLKLIEHAVDIMGRDYTRGDSDATVGQGFLEHLTELWFTTESLDLSGMHEMEDVRRALVNNIQDLFPEPKGEEASASTSASSGQAASAAPGASAVPAAAAVEEPKGGKEEAPTRSRRVLQAGSDA